MSELRLFPCKTLFSTFIGFVTKSLVPTGIVQFVQKKPISGDVYDQVQNDNEEVKLSNYGLIRQMRSLDLVV